MKSYLVFIVMCLLALAQAAKKAAAPTGALCTETCNCCIAKKCMDGVDGHPECSIDG
jgi:hypothetical protein